MEFEDSFLKNIASDLPGEDGPDAYAAVLARIRDRLSPAKRDPRHETSGPFSEATTSWRERDGLRRE